MNVCGYEKYIFRTLEKHYMTYYHWTNHVSFIHLRCLFLRPLTNPMCGAAEIPKLVVGQSGNVRPVTGIAFHYTNCVVPLFAFCLINFISLAGFEHFSEIIR